MLIYLHCSPPSLPLPHTPIQLHTHTHTQTYTPQVSVGMRGVVPSQVNTQVYSLVLQVSDNGLPPRSDLTTVVIRVNRNLNAPYFTQTSYQFVTYEDLPVGSNVGTQLQGADDDDLSPWNLYYFRMAQVRKPHNFSQCYVDFLSCLLLYLLFIALYYSYHTVDLLLVGFL